MPGHDGRERGAGDRAEAAGVDGGEAVGARADELSGLCGGDGGVPGGGCVPVLLGVMVDRVEQRGVGEDFEGLGIAAGEDFEDGGSGGGVAIYRREGNWGEGRPLRVEGGIT